MKPTLLLTLILTLILRAATRTPAATPRPKQKAPPSPSAQAQLEERVEKLEGELSDQKQKLTTAELENGYIERVETDTKAYYEKAFNSQIIILSILALVVGIVGKFGVDHVVEAKLTQAQTALREEFMSSLADRFGELKEAYTAGAEQTKATLAGQIAELAEDLQLRVGYETTFARALAIGAAGQLSDALDGFRNSLQIYDRCNSRLRSILKAPVASAISNILHAIERLNPQNREEALIKELQDKRYDNLENELDSVARQTERFALAIRKARPAPRQPAV